MNKLAILLGTLALASCAWGAEVPRKAPDVAIPLIDGKTIKTSDYLGKVVVFAVILTT